MRDINREIVLGYVPSGRAKAIGKAELARLAGLNERTVRELIVELIERGEPIGSTSDSETGGYFLCRDAEDFKLAAAELQSRGVRILRRCRLLQEAARRSLDSAPTLFDWSEVA